jgi:hypothetical protein
MQQKKGVSTWSVQMWITGARIVQSRVEAGSNTSTVALRVIGGDEKGTPVPGGMTGPPCSWGI